jgi:hypothetical protein
MYKHAFYRPRLSDELEPYNKDVRRANLAAAGVKPPASQDFIDGVKLALNTPKFPKYNHALQSKALNRMRVYDANGEPWTHSSLRTFLKYFVPFSN